MRDFSELRKIYGDQEGSPWKLASYEHYVDTNFVPMTTLSGGTTLHQAQHVETIRIEMIAAGNQSEPPRMFGIHNIGGCLLTRHHVESGFDSDDNATRFKITFSVEE